MNTYSNLVELLQDRATTQGGARAYTWLENGEAETRVLTYAQLHAHTRAVAQSLREQLAPLDRVLLVFEPGLDFIVAFLACQLAGVVAVPVYPPQRPEDGARLAAIARDCAASGVCTQGAYAPLLAAGLTALPGLSGLRVIATDVIDVSSCSDDVVFNASLDPDAPSFLQYTSGSTGTPKGVVVSHANLLHNQSIIRQGFGNDRSTIAVTWLPQYHDMGLIGGILQPLYVGGQSVLMSPFAFLQQPIRWLRAITKYRGTVSGSPNFAYELCVRRITDDELAELDLSSWCVAFNGAEPIRVATLERFAARFAQAGFRRASFFPCYGLAEGTLYVTAARRDRFPTTLHVDAATLEQNTLLEVALGAEKSRTIVGCGAPIEQIVRTVDPVTRIATANGSVGEIWVSGPSIARGYWGRPELSRETFDARIDGTDEGPFLRTGDLGVLHGGELYVTGRLKELVIVDGRNHYPQDIEETVQNDRPMLRRGCGAAFSIDVDGSERIVMVQEIARDVANLDYERLAVEIRESVAAKHGLALHEIVFAPQGAIKKTSSGKIRRLFARDGYLAGKLESLFRSVGVVLAPRASVPLPSMPPQADDTTPDAPLSQVSRDPRSDAEQHVGDLLCSLVAAYVGIEPRAVDRELPFSAFGLQSRELVGLSGVLEKQLGRRLSPQIFYNYATVAKLARHLAGEADLDAAPASRRFVGAKPHASSGAGTNGRLAIVGMACRLPGAPNIDAYWDLLVSGRDAITRVPEARYDVARWYDPDPSVAGKMATQWGGFIDDVDAFDADFFGISAREAEAMDPQQRIVLELVWHALEDAGIRPEALRGTRTGVFVGISGNDYARLQSGTTDLLSAHAGTGNSLSIVANRISYFMDLRGPSVSLDTACSSSLSAVHEASLHLASGGCDLAIVAAVNLLLAPDVTVSLSQNRMMAADGHCKTFSKDADGYVRAEGAGVVVLRREGDAVAAGERIHAVIAATACNQDGRSNGLTAPNGLAQREVVREALDKAGWAARDVHMVETHGTGTRLGDPIEAEALAAAYGEGREASSPLVLGAVKSQIGHLEAAAGMAGLIKVALCLTKGVIPANLHCAETNPLISETEWKLALPRAVTPFPVVAVGDRTSRRRAGVSAFGFGGTNAHVLVEEARVTPEAAVRAPLASIVVPAKAYRNVVVLPLSARTESALASLGAAYQTRIADDSATPVASLCHAAAAQRGHFREARRAAFGRTSGDLARALADAPLDAPTARLAKRGVAFVFTGQGTQHVAMGHALYETHDGFRATLDACARALASRGNRPHGLLDVLFPSAENTAEGDALLARADYTQLALFALEVALAQVWLGWGLQPSVVMGHSLGEIAAATVAGVFSLDDGMKLVEARGRLMHALPEAGGMLVVFAHERDLDDVLARADARIGIAAFNGPGQIVLSGPVASLEKARRALEHRGIQTKRLKVTHAFHSPLMQPMLEDFRRVAESLSYGLPKVPLISNVTGRVESSRLASAAYWVEHVVAPVRFHQSVEHLKALDVGVLLEIGPRPVLVGMARRILGEPNYLFRASLDPKESNWTTLSSTVATLYEAGIDLDAGAFADAPAPADVVRAPLYPFAKKRHWFSASPHAASLAATRPGVHPLLGRALSSPRMRAGELHYESDVCLPGPAFFRLTVEPAERRLSLLAYLEMALEAQHNLFPGEARRVRDVFLEGLVQVAQGESCTLQTLCEPVGGGEHRMEVWTPETSAGRDGWRRVAQAKLCADAGALPTVPTLDDVRARVTQPLDVDAWYESTREGGFRYWVSPHKAIQKLWWAPSEVLADIKLRDEDDAGADGIWMKHAIWHACNQVAGALCPRDGHGTYFPVSLEEVRFLGNSGRSLVLHGRIASSTSDTRGCSIDMTAYAEDGTPVVVLKAIRMIPDETQRRHRGEWQKAAPDERLDYLRETLRRLVARAFKRAPEEIGFEEPLASLGLDSLTAIEIGTRVEQLFEVGIHFAGLQEGMGVDGLARMLNDNLEAAEGGAALPRPTSTRSPVIELNRGDASLTPLFLLPPTGGTVFCYRELARHLGAQPIVALQSPALAAADGSTPPFETFEALASYYVRAVRERQPRGPYLLGGWSMGGVLAFEMARQLEESGEEIAGLLMIDAMAPAPETTAFLDASLEPSSTSKGNALTLLARSLGVRIDGASAASLSGNVDAALEKLLLRARDPRDGTAALTHGELRRLLAEFERNLALLGAYAGRAYAGSATILRAETPLRDGDAEASGRDWEMWLAGIDAMHTLPGDHFGLLSGSHVILTASYVRKMLKAASHKGRDAGSDDRTLSLLHPRSQGNIVVASPTRTPDGVVRGGLLVDETHPYFFDHPLDHVSGILMLEGLLQLVETTGTTRDGFVRNLRLTFPRFCEKADPVALEVTVGHEGEPQVGRAVQGGLPVCTMRIHTDAVTTTALDVAPRLITSRVKAETLHKVHGDNVLLGDVRIENGIARGDVVSPPAGHVLAEGDPLYHSPLFALEATRQLVTYLAHSAYGVPFGMPMNLVGVELHLDAPIPRNAPLTLVHTLVHRMPVGASTFALFEVQLVVGETAIGHCRITAQLVTREAYRKVRHARNGAAAAA